MGSVFNQQGPFVMDKTAYIKYSRDGIVYYIREDIVPNIMRLERIESASNIHLMQYSDYVVNSNENKIIKCRYMLEDLIDAAVTARPIRRPGDMVADSVENLRDEMAKRSDDATVREILFKLNSCLYKQYPHHR